MTINTSDIARLSARTSGHYASGGFRAVYVGDLNAVAALASGIADAAATISTQHSAILAVAGETAGIGWSGLLVPRHYQLGEMAFLDERAARGKFVKSLAGAATLVVADFGKLINCTNGTYTVGLPAAAEAGAGWVVTVANNGGGTITLDGDGADTINGTATISIAAGTSREIVWASSGSWIAAG